MLATNLTIQSLTICIRHPDAPGALMLTVKTPDGIIISGELSMLTLQDNQTVSASIAPVDAKGNPAQVDGVPSWSSSDPGLLTVVASADGLSAVIAAVGPLGTAQLQVAADADLGEGIVPLVATADITIVGGQAVALTINFDAPVSN
jgi:hypothetical protein